MDKILNNITNSHIVTTDAAGFETTIDIAYSNYDVFGNAIGSVSQVPGTRESLLTSVPLGAVTLEVPSTAIFGAVSAVFEVSQF